MSKEKMNEIKKLMKQNIKKEESDKERNEE